MATIDNRRYFCVWILSGVFQRSRNLFRLDSYYTRCLQGICKISMFITCLFYSDCFLVNIILAMNQSFFSLDAAYFSISVRAFLPVWLLSCKHCPKCLRANQHWNAQCVRSQRINLNGDCQRTDRIPSDARKTIGFAQRKSSAFVIFGRVLSGDTRELARIDSALKFSLCISNTCEEFLNSLQLLSFQVSEANTGSQQMKLLPHRECLYNIFCLYFECYLKLFQFLKKQIINNLKTRSNHKQLSDISLY